MMRADGPLHLMRRRSNHFDKCSLARSVFGVTKYILYHDHRTIHHHAEIQRTQREQIGRNMTQVEQDGGKEQGKGNCDGDNQRAAHIAQEEKQNQRDQQNATRQIAKHGGGGVADENASVEMRDYLYPGGKLMGVQLRNLHV
jgi:hypothetical protein